MENAKNHQKGTLNKPNLCHKLPWQPTISATFSIGLRVVPQYKVEHCHETSSLVPSCAAQDLPRTKFPIADLQ